MTCKINVLSSISQRLEKYRGTQATLYGVRSANALNVVTFMNQPVADDENYENILPGGLERIGVLAVSIDEINTENNEIAIIKKDDKLQCHILKDGAFKPVAHKVVDSLDLAVLRLQTKFSIQLSTKEEETDGFLEKLLNKLESNAASFLMDQSSVVLIRDNESAVISSVIHGAPQDVNVEELAGYTKDDDEEDDNVKKSKRGVDKNAPISFKFYWSSVLEEAGSIPQCAPLIYHQKRINQVMCLSLSLDTVSIIPWSDPAERIAPILCTSLTRQLKLIIEDLKEQLVHSSINSIEIPKIFHFHPELLEHFVSLAYHPEKSDSSLESYRKQLHQWFDLPLDRPLFRRPNKFWFDEDYQNQRQLINTHVGLNMNGGEISVVQGRYAYHHYMQDNFDDNGWGCAYRSLQTIISWFKLQGYIDRTIPTHQEIQKCLVDIGDKPANFVNSRLWIGSMEVSFCLQSLIGVESTILNVSSGAEMSSKARQLAEHFRIHGTPVMIGGGVLAHTIIGIDYNEETGDARFLILDPHYTGAEDLRTIQNKGWCNWKPSSFWKADSFYNMCLPLKPVCF